MATISLPTTRPYWPAAAEFGLQAAVFESESATDLSIQTTDMLAARWVCNITWTAHDNDTRAAVEALMAQLRGRANRLSMGHPLRRAPRGTMRGTPTLNGSHSALASSISISGSGTLMAGDMLGIDGELVMVTADNPQLSAVPITPFLRTGKTTGTSVVWDWPRALFVLANADAIRVPFGQQMAPSFSVDLVEVFA